MIIWGLTKEQVLQLLREKKMAVPENEQDEQDYPVIAVRIDETSEEVLREAIIEYLYGN